MRASAKRARVATTVEEIADLVAEVRSEIKISNLILEGESGRAQARLQCVRRDVPDDVAEQVKLLTDDIFIKDSVALSCPVQLPDGTKTSSVIELADWLRSNCLPRYHADETLPHRIQSLKAIAKRANIWGVGNCAELAAICFVKLRKLKLSGVDTVEYLNLDDHALLVVNRNSDSSLDNYDDWGEGAIVVDAWYNEVYELRSVLSEESSQASWLDIQSSESFELYADAKPLALKSRSRFTVWHGTDDCKEQKPVETVASLACCSAAKS